jgi:hypothetical protein
MEFGDEGSFNSIAKLYGNLSSRIDSLEDIVDDLKKKVDRLIIENVNKSITEGATYPTGDNIYPEDRTNKEPLGSQFRSEDFTINKKRDKSSIFDYDPDKIKRY